jgi:hypothetical protein
MYQTCNAFEIDELLVGKRDEMLSFARSKICYLYKTKTLYLTRGSQEVY